jgi:hypothetical protein
MNERINKLFGQAMDQSIPETWTTLTHSQLSILKDKFAELIVKECANHCDLLLDHKISSEWSRGTHDCSRAIKKHFGVEE